MDISERVAGIVNEWFQGLPTTREQQRDRSGLIRELVHEMENVRAAVGEEIAQTIGTERAKRAASACCEGTGYCGIDDCRSDAVAVNELDYAARIARAHGKEA
jgi:hypothetical protein